MLLDSTSGQQYNNSETTAPQSIDNLRFIPDLLYLSNEGMLQDEYVPCPDCNHPNAYENWCQPCNAKRFLEKFSSWTSENKFIDTFIHTNQINAMSMFEVLEWIPYNRLREITYVAKGRFGDIYKAIWIDGRIIKWNHENNNWHRVIGLIDDNWKYKAFSGQNSENLKTGLLVALKRLNGSLKINDKFLNELKYHLNVFKMTGFLFPLLGITQDPETSEYIIVMNYAHGGSLRDNLQNISRMSWKKRLFILNSIIFGLAGIHQLRIVHKDLHSGNILMCNSLDENDDWNISLINIKNDTIKQAIIQFRNADIEIQSPNLQEDFTMRTINIFDIIAEYEENEEKNNNIICEAPMEQDDNN
ncbi:34082_t:CDS:2 [Gigaspora margarita]|uniref:34082_t:CDS:1 n=1 Tax=Gigaspora margarita TaxID=4874 RepID=A0ABN7UFQ6_GIGMA|nr:34082_t:CDS:2 [Gigaspora margarita]